MAMPRTPRHRWIDAGLRALATGGPDAVRIEALAQALGVTKGGFYGYFADRQALLDEMLDGWERDVIDDVIARVEDTEGDARARLRRLFELTASDEADAVLTTELAIRDWARRDPAIADRLRRVDDRRMEYLRSLFGEFCSDADEVEARCLVVLSLFVAERFLVSDHGGRTRADVLAPITRWLLGAGS